MATAVSISIRREAAMKKLAANAAGIGDSFPDLPPLDLTRKSKDNEIEQVSILERIADYLRLVQMAMIEAENERVFVAEASVQPSAPAPKPAAPKPKAKPKSKAARRR